MTQTKTYQDIPKAYPRHTKVYETPLTLLGAGSFRVILSGVLEGEFLFLPLALRKG